jgi:hypothetical protein
MALVNPFTSKSKHFIHISCIFNPFLMEELPNTASLVDEIISRTKNINYADNRVSLPTVEFTSEIFDLNLIGKVISSRNFNQYLVKEIVTRAWSPSWQLTISKMDYNVFLFTFENPSDLEKVFRKRPWTLRGAHLVLKKWAPDLLGNEIDFSKSSFWVQVHGLLGLWQQPFYLKRICGEIGQVLEEDFVSKVQLPWRKFAWIHVDVDITKPLKLGVFLPRKNWDDLWVGFKYEKLPDVHINCGIIGHLARNCNVPFSTLSNQFGVRFQAFGD